MKKNKICVVDDNQAVCHSLEMLLHCVYGRTLEILTYTNPATFLQEVSSEWRGCLLIDLFMPYWNGLDLMKELERRQCSMHCIMMSGHGNKSVAAQSLEAGAHAFISKPLNSEHLLQTINDILGLTA